MAIGSVNFSSVSKFAQKAGNAFKGSFSKLPNIQLGEKAFGNANKISKFISNPVGNRLVLAGTGILLQPTIDYYNKKVDRKTREVSATRTAAKIIAGTAVGLVVRGACLALSKNPKFIPEFVKGSQQSIDKFRIIFSTLSAMAVMTVTNFLVDAPLTTKLSNYMLERKEQKEANKQ